MNRLLTIEQSEHLMDLYNLHDGVWNLIMEDEEIKKINITKNQLQGHRQRLHNKMKNNNELGLIRLINDDNLNKKIHFTRSTKKKVYETDEDEEEVEDDEEKPNNKRKLIQISNDENRKKRQKKDDFNMEDVLKSTMITSIQNNQLLMTKLTSDDVEIKNKTLEKILVLEKDTKMMNDKIDLILNILQNK